MFKFTVYKNSWYNFIKFIVNTEDQQGFTMYSIIAAIFIIFNLIIIDCC